MNALTARLCWLRLGHESEFTLRQSMRGYATVRKLPVKWIPPVKPSCLSKEKSCDGGLDFGIKPEDPINELMQSKELEKADEIVKKLSSLHYHPAKKSNNAEISKAMSLCQRHDLDTSSMETTCIVLTARILRMQKQLENHKHAVAFKVSLKELIERRQKYLKKLRERDYACFEYILEKCNLTFYAGIRPEDNIRLTEKSCEKRYLQKYCDEMVQKKLAAYHAELKSQQKEFFQNKVKQLEFIRNEELACGVTPTITEEEIAAAKDKAASFV